MNIKVIEDNYSLALQTKIRSINTEREDLEDSLTKLGNLVGYKIVSENMLIESEVSTPMNELFQGYLFSNSCNLVYSTKDDYQYFAKGISSYIPDALQGYFDFQGVRGLDALNQPVRAASHPPIKPGTIIDTVIIAKSVLATGCTAISLARNIISKYQPKRLIIASAFYSKTGIKELLTEIPKIEFIYVIGKPDQLNGDGMLTPGMGNLDDRLSS